MVQSVAIWILLSMVGVGAGATQLTPNGNDEVAKTFALYLAKAPGCEPLPDQRRVLITGFGPFGGNMGNVSGQVSDAMMDPGFWPNEVNTDSSSGFGKLSPDHPGHNSASDAGGRAEARLLKLDGQTYQICFVVIDTWWDLSAAIVVKEMERFQPAVVIMTGVGADRVIFEAGASNITDGMNGFDYIGNLLPDNFPVSTSVLPPKDPGVKDTVDLSWDPVAAHQSAQGLIQAMGFESITPSGPRPENNYICNHAAYLIENAARGVKLNLAGGELPLSPAPTRRDTRTGFMHYPAQAGTQDQDLFNWGRVLAKVVRTLLP